MLCCISLFTFAADISLDFTAQNYTNQQEVSSLTVDGVTATFDKGTNNNAPKYYTSGNAIRVYGGGTVTVSSTIGNITKIVIVFGGTDGTNAITADSGTFTEDTWTGDAASVVFTVGGTSGNRRFAAINVTTGGSVTPADPVDVTSIALSETELSLVEGKTATLTVTYTPANANQGKTITWTSSDEKVATVADGVVTAVAEGTATITATPEKGKGATCTVTVTAKPAPSGNADVIDYEFIGVSGTNYSEWKDKTGASGAVYAGQSAGGNESIQLRSNNNNSGVVVTTSAGNVSSVTIKFNSNTNAARVVSIYGSNTAYTAASDLYGDNAGTLIADVAIADGAEQTIDVAAKGEYAYVGVRSKNGALYLDEIAISWGNATPQQPVDVTSIALSETELSLVEGKTATLTVTYTPANANQGKTITWTSSDEKVATVADGVVTAVAEGTATITATPEKGKGATCTVTVTAKPAPSGNADVIDYEFIGVSGTNYSEWKDKTGASGAVYAGQSAGGNESIQLRSNNNNSGVVVTTSAGNVSSVTIKFNSNTNEARVVSIYGSNTAYTAATDLYGDNAGTLIADVAIADGAEQTIDVAAKGEYAYVGVRSKNGALYLDEIAISWGNATPQQPVDVTSIALSETELSLVEGKTATLTVTYTPANANQGKTITWTSSDEKVATVADGVVTAVAEGTATITATPEKGKGATCTVTVTAKPAPSGNADVIDYEFIGVSGTNYSEWKDKTGASGAVYAGQSAGGNESIQLRSNNSNSGVVVTTSAGNVSSVTIKFNSSTNEARVVSIYGSNTAYTAATDLYGDNAGTLIADVAIADGAEQTIDVAAKGEYAYVGVRSKNGALYLDEIAISWGNATPQQPVDVTSIALSETELSLVEGKTATLTVTYTPANANQGKTITWTSSDEKVATVADGVVTAVAEGTATITATPEKGTGATCTVTVTAKPAPQGGIVRALVAELDGTFYAMTANIASGKAEAIEVTVDGEKAYVADAAAKASVEWLISPAQTEGAYYIQPAGDDTKYLRFSNTNLSLGEAFEWTLNEDGNYINGTRGLLYRSGDINAFKSYAFSNAGSGEYSTQAKAYEVEIGNAPQVASIKANPEEVEFDVTLSNGSAEASQTVAITGANLAEVISVSIAGAEKFVVSPATIPAAGGELTISLNASEAGTYNAVITLESKDADENVVSATIKVTAVVKEEGSTPILAGGYVKVTEEPADWSGHYLIVFADEAGSVAFNGALETLDVASNKIAVTDLDGFIAATEEINAAAVTIEAVEGGYSLKTSSNQYLNHTGSSNTLNASQSPAANTISLNDDGFAVIAVGDYHIRYNSASGQERFRYYKTDANVYLYKYASDAVGVENIEAQYQALDLNAPMYNVVGQRVDASYKGIVIQNGQKYLLR